MASSLRLAYLSAVKSYGGLRPAICSLSTSLPLRRALPVCSSCIVQQHRSSSVTAFNSKPSIWSRFKAEMGFVGKLQVPKRVLVLAGYNMYMCCTELVDYKQIFKVLDLPDTFNSWFLVTNLHVWLCMVKLVQLDKEGTLLRNNLVQAMWTDVDKRSKQLGEDAGTTKRREGIRTMGDSFYASLFAYDEGLLSSDKVLAGAIWRLLLEMRDTEPERLEIMVEYVRKQVQHLDKQDPAVLMAKGLVTFLPLVGDKEDVERNRKILRTIYNRPVYL